MDLQRLVLFAVQASVLLTLFGFGLQATRDDLLYLVRRPLILGRSLLAMFVVMPIVVVVLAQAFSLRFEVRIALVALAISPVPPLLPRRQGSAGGRASFALALMATSAALSILIVPLSVAVLGRYLAQSFQISSAAIAALALKSVLAPLLAGILLRSVRPAVAERFSAPSAVAAGVLLVVGVVGILAGTVPAMWAQIGDGTIVAMAAFIIIGLAVGHLLGGPDPQDRIVLALSTACRHPAIALVIVAANFPGTRVGATILLFMIVGTLLCLPYTLWQRRISDTQLLQSGALSG